MAIILEPNTPLNGFSPWVVGEFTVTSEPLKIEAFGLGSDDLICVKSVLKKSIDSGSYENDGCKTNAPDGLEVVATEYLTDCGTKICICKKQAWTVITIPGTYQLEVSGTNIQNHLVTVQMIPYTGSLEVQASNQCKVCEPATPTVPAATFTLTPCPANGTFNYAGVVYNMPSQLIKLKTDIEALYGITTSYNPTDCIFTVTGGIGTPPPNVTLIPVVIPPAPPVYCPSYPMPNGGFAYGLGDSIDPLATTKLQDGCTGSDDIYWLYPTPALGHTVPVPDCSGTVLGYAANKSDCAPACAC
jgi:hypothetical protein